MADRVGCKPAGTFDWSSRAPQPIEPASSRHTATAAGASEPAITTPSDSYSAGKTSVLVGYTWPTSKKLTPERRCDSLKAMAFNKPGRNDVRKTSSPTTSGFIKRTASPGSPAFCRSPSVKNGCGMASLKPRPNKISRTRRRRC